MAAQGSADEYYDAVDYFLEDENDSNPFLNLPIEVLLHICSFLQVKDIVFSLSLVCKRFHHILSDENIWKTWFSRKWGVRQPIMAVTDDKFDWKNTCFAVEREWKFWKSNAFAYGLKNEAHISSVDAVLLLNSGRACISGSRDRTLILWNLEETGGTLPVLRQKQTAHEGWIWRLLETGDVIYSCSWDNTVKGWILEHDLIQKYLFKCTSPVLSLAVLDDTVFAGDYGKKVYAFDPRVGQDAIFSYVAHTRAVLTLGSSGSCIISGSEDKHVAVWDVRIRKVREKIEIGKNCFPNCSSMDQNVVYIGDNKGTVHVFKPDPTKLQLVTSLDLGHTKSVSALKHGTGYLVTGSLDGTVRISVPSIPPHAIRELLSYGKGVSGLDYQRGTLAVGCSNTVEFWMPSNSSSY